MTAVKGKLKKENSSITSDIANISFIFQTKTYDSVTDKFMDFSFEKVKALSSLCFCTSFYISVARRPG